MQRVVAGVGEKKARGNESLAGRDAERVMENGWDKEADADKHATKWKMGFIVQKMLMFRVWRHLKLGSHTLGLFEVSAKD